MSGLLLDKLSKSYPSNAGDAAKALEDVSFTIEDGCFFTLLGPSGCGKTTLLRIIAGFEVPDTGTAILDGKNLLRVPPNHRPVNTVFQSYALFPHMTVTENVQFGLRMLGMGEGERAQRAESILRMMKLDNLGERKPSQLSGGQQQRVALARALAPKPKILLLDEPLSALDLKLRKEMQLEMKRIQQETGTTFIFVTHDQDEALTMSDTIAVMGGGKVQQIGTPQEIYEGPKNRFVAEFIGEMNLVEVDRYADAPSGMVRFETPMGLLDVRADKLPVRPLTPVLGIRPEQIRVSELASRAQTNQVKGRVRQIVYSGTHAVIILQVEDSGAVFQVRVSTADTHGLDLAVGRLVHASFAPEHLKVFSA